LKLCFIEVSPFWRVNGGMPILAVIFVASGWCQSISIVPAPVVTLPSPTDSNSPGHWWQGKFALFNAMGEPYRSEGPDQFNLGDPELVTIISAEPKSMWIESTWTDEDGTLFGWYHHEPAGLCAENSLTAPKIGALVSYDNGITFQDLGFVLESGDPIDCTSRNGYFAGGNGDFTVVLDNDRKYFYFLYSNYGGDVTTQGVAVARMKFQDRFNPTGTVQKYFNEDFTEPGIGGRVSPIYPAKVGWVQADTDAFWGPSVHWNTALKKWVMLLNHSCCSPGWPQEGIYLSTNADISNAGGWSAPVRVLNAYGWYPQVIGEGPGETDKLVGAVSRLYVGGWSWAELIITNDTPPLDGDPEPVDSKAAVQTPRTY
jgi:hypothetical protein